IGGDGVARGYYNNEELTNKKFIANPFAVNPPLLYRTGDVVRLHSSGNVEYIGRSDDQIKLGGNRIEIGEIENAILRYQYVKQAVVVPRKDAMSIHVLYNSGGFTAKGLAINFLFVSSSLL
ncbi:MAG: hypothetical protein ACKO96_13520, partial [Flammeovirgaceae bacterium]